MTPEQKLVQLGITLPAEGPPGGNYENFVISGNLLFLAGKGWPVRAAGIDPVPKVGREISVEEGYADARIVGIALIGAMKKALGELSRVKKVVKVLGMVNAHADFTEQPKVINGCRIVAREKGGKGAGHGQRACGFHRAAEGDQRLLRPVRGSVR